MNRVKRFSDGHSNPRAECEDCDWVFFPREMTRQEARAHARNNIGHHVVVVVEKRDVYIRREE